MLDARVKLRQKAQLAELCSRWVGTKCITFFLFFSLRRVKSQRVLDIYIFYDEMRALCALLFCDVTKDSLLSYYTHTLTIFKTDMRQIMKELVVTIDEDLDVRRINIILFFPSFFPFFLSFLTVDISSQCHVALFI